MTAAAPAPTGAPERLGTRSRPSGALPRRTWGAGLIGEARVSKKLLANVSSRWRDHPHADELILVAGTRRNVKEKRT